MQHTLAKPCEYNLEGFCKYLTTLEKLTDILIPRLAIFIPSFAIFVPSLGMNIASLGMSN